MVVYLHCFTFLPFYRYVAVTSQLHSEQGGSDQGTHWVGD
jgi:hypothetical protein